MLFKDCNNIATNPYKMQFSIKPHIQKVIIKNNEISIANEVSFQFHSNSCSTDCFYCFKKGNIIKSLNQEITQLNDNCNLLIELLKSKRNLS